MTDKIVSMIKNGLRRIFSRSPLKTEALGKARIKRGLYKCAKCCKGFDRKSIQIDHINPVINPSTGFNDWNEYIERLFTDNLQVLCLECHRRKTNKENKKRRK